MQVPESARRRRDKARYWPVLATAFEPPNLAAFQKMSALVEHYFPKIALFLAFHAHRSSPCWGIKYISLEQHPVAAPCKTWIEPTFSSSSGSFAVWCVGVQPTN